MNKNNNDTPKIKEFPKYFPNIGEPNEMSPINDVTNRLDKEKLPVIEVTPKSGSGLGIIGLE